MNPVPVIFTVVPPLVDPEVGVSEEMVGVGALKVYVSPVPDVAVPPGVVSWTLTAPDTPDFVTALTIVGLVTVKLDAVVDPNLTAVAPMNPVPVIVTVVPPLVVPEVGVSEEMVGVGALKVYVSPVPDVAVPPAVVTLTLTAPATWGLVLAWTVVLVLEMIVAAVVPNLTKVAPLKFVPVTVTVVPPLVVPEVGVTALIVGSGVINVKSVGHAVEPPEVLRVTRTAPAAWEGLTTLICVVLVSS